MKTLYLAVAGLLGLLFGIGLLLSGMANPEKVLGFFSIRSWDPSLALVMAGAVGVALPGFALAQRLEASMSGKPMQWPKTRHIDSRLIIGSATFGCGWGLAGICPGPALVLLGSGALEGALFVASMLLGMMLFEKFAAGPHPRN